MKVKDIKYAIQGYSDDAELFCVIYDREDADVVFEGDALTDDEYESLLMRLEKDDGLWQEISSAWRYYIFDIIEKREKGKVNVSGK